MALIKCSECGADISEKASACPKCGCPLDITKQVMSDAKKKKNKKVIIFFIVVLAFIMETKNPVFSMLSSVKCRNSQEINDFSTLSDTLFYPLSQNQKYLQSGFHPNPEGYRKSTVRLDNC